MCCIACLRQGGKEGEMECLQLGMRRHTHTHTHGRPARLLQQHTSTTHGSIHHPANILAQAQQERSHTYSHFPMSAITPAPIHSPAYMPIRFATLFLLFGPQCTRRSAGKSTNSRLKAM